MEKKAVGKGGLGMYILLKGASICQLPKMDINNKLWLLFLFIVDFFRKNLLASFSLFVSTF